MHTAQHTVPIANCARYGSTPSHAADRSAGTTDATRDTPSTNEIDAQ